MRQTTSRCGGAVNRAKWYHREAREERAASGGIAERRKRASSLPLTYARGHRSGGRSGGCGGGKRTVLASALCCGHRDLCMKNGGGMTSAGVARRQQAAQTSIPASIMAALYRLKADQAKCCAWKTGKPVARRATAASFLPPRCRRIAFTRVCGAGAWRKTQRGGDPRKATGVAASCAFAPGVAHRGNAS